MPSPLQTIESSPAADLASLRAELDGLDDALHDTLMHRAEVVAQIATLGVKGVVPHRPGREASILRRLLARHDGGLPASGVVRIWRELIGAFTAQQRAVLVAVCEVEGDPAYAAAAREHFGALTPLRAHRTPAQAISDVSAGIATVAVLPLPMQDEAPAAAWWTALLHTDGSRVHVVARLPFWSPRPEGSPKVKALVVSVAAPDPSGADRSLLGLELALDVSQARLHAAIATAGFQTDTIVLRRDPGAPVAHALVDVDGFVMEDDMRLAALQSVLRPPVVLGAYAMPLNGPLAAEA